MYDFEDNDISDNHYNFNVGYDDAPMKQLNYRPTVSYKYLDYNTTEFCFNTKHFGKGDAKTYFQKMNEYAQYTLDELINESHHTEHFRVSGSSDSPEYSLLEELIGVELSDETTPILGHFALYTTKFDPTNPSQKCPRIFFIVGENSVLHILFYDPFHKIHPMSDETRKALSN